MEQIFLECFLSGTQGRTTQHFEPRGEKSQVGRLFTFTIRSDKGVERVSPASGNTSGFQGNYCNRISPNCHQRSCRHQPTHRFPAVPTTFSGQPREHWAQRRLCFHGVEAFPTQPAFSLDTSCHSVLRCPSSEDLIAGPHDESTWASTWMPVGLVLMGDKWNSEHQMIPFPEGALEHRQLKLFPMCHRGNMCLSVIQGLCDGNEAPIFPVPVCWLLCKTLLQPLPGLWYISPAFLPFFPHHLMHWCSVSSAV